MSKVINYNTGSDPNPEVLFTGSAAECVAYMRENKIPDNIGVEIDSKLNVDECFNALVKAKERIAEALYFAKDKKGFEDERAHLVSAMVCINNILER